MKLSIIICVFNEASTIEEIYKRVRNVKLIKNIKKEIIIVDNNSNDGTLEKLKKFKKDLDTLIIFQNQNYGKGNSIIEGLKHAKGEYVKYSATDWDLRSSITNFISELQFRLASFLLSRYTPAAGVELRS